MLDLQPRYLEILKDLFQQYIPNMQVWAYGSRVKHQAHQGSDLDLVVINPDNPDSPQVSLLGLRAAIEDSRIPILIDVIDWANIPESFQAEIKNSMK